MGNFYATPLRWKPANPHGLSFEHASSPIADIDLSPFTVKTEKNRKFDINDLSNPSDYSSLTMVLRLLNMEMVERDSLKELVP